MNQQHQEEYREITEARMLAWSLELQRRQALPIALIGVAQRQIITLKPAHISEEHLVAIINWALTELKQRRPPHATRLPPRPRPHGPGPGPPG